MLGCASRRWVASVVRSTGARCSQALAPPFASSSTAPLHPAFALRPRENKLISCNELIASHNGISKTCFMGNKYFLRYMSTVGQAEVSSTQESSVPSPEIELPQRIKFKRLDKTAKNIMNILDKEEVGKVLAAREIPDIRPGYLIQMKVEILENKRRHSTVKGIVIARRNAGMNTTFRLRRTVSGVGIESVYPLYSPNIKEIQVVSKKSVRRAKLYYLRERMNRNKK